MARVGLSTNRKFHRLTKALDNNRALARGVLELLWDPCHDCGDPYVGTSQDIEEVCGWRGPKGALTKALLEAGAPKGAGFIEPYGGDVRGAAGPHYQIHDFTHHSPEYAKAQRRRELELAAPPRICPVDGAPYHSKSTRSLYCSDRCRQIARRAALARVRPGADRVTTAVTNAVNRDRVQTAGQPSGHTRTYVYSTSGSTKYVDSTNKKYVDSTSSTYVPYVVSAEAKKSDRPVDRPVTEPTTDAPVAVIDVVIPDDPLELTFPTIGTDGHEWYLNRSHVETWTDLYPGLSVLDECRKALSWLMADPARRKTKKGMLRFLVGWLNRATEGRGGRGPTLITGSLKTAGNQEALRRFVERGGRK